jgi:hypothetical protein
MSSPMSDSDSESSGAPRERGRRKQSVATVGEEDMTVAIADTNFGIFDMGFLYAVRLAENEDNDSKLVNFLTHGGYPINEVENVRTELAPLMAQLKQCAQAYSNLKRVNWLLQVSSVAKTQLEQQKKARKAEKDKQDLLAKQMAQEAKDRSDSIQREADSFYDQYVLRGRSPIEDRWGTRFLLQEAKDILQRINITFYNGFKGRTQLEEPIRQDNDTITVNAVINANSDNIRNIQESSFKADSKPILENLLQNFRLLHKLLYETAATPSPPAATPSPPAATPTPSSVPSGRPTPSQPPKPSSPQPTPSQRSTPSQPPKPSSPQPTPSQRSTPSSVQSGQPTPPSSPGAAEHADMNMGDDADGGTHQAAKIGKHFDQLGGLMKGYYDIFTNPDFAELLLDKDMESAKFCEIFIETFADTLQIDKKKWAVRNFTSVFLSLGVASVLIAMRSLGKSSEPSTGKLISYFTYRNFSEPQYRSNDMAYDMILREIAKNVFQMPVSFERKRFFDLQYPRYEDVQKDSGFNVQYQQAILVEDASKKSKSRKLQLMDLRKIMRAPGVNTGQFKQGTRDKSETESDTNSDTDTSGGRRSNVFSLQRGSFRRK